MYNSQKISFSLPKKDLDMLEKIRKRMGICRSTFIDMAIRFWLNSMHKQELINRYVEGYKKMPEQTRELRAIEKAGLETFTPLEEW